MKMSKRVKIIWVVILYAILAFFAVSTFLLAKSSTAVKVGDKAPGFTLEDLEGNQVRLSDFGGKPVMLNFFATWCPPCIEEAPDIQRFQESHGDKIKILIIDRAEPKKLVQEFVEKFDSTSTYLLDTYDSLSRPYGVVGQPETFFIDQNGIVREHIIGPMTYKQLVAQYEKLMD